MSWDKYQPWNACVSTCGISLMGDDIFRIFKTRIFGDSDGRLTSPWNHFSSQLQCVPNTGTGTGCMVSRLGLQMAITNYVNDKCPALSPTAVQLDFKAKQRPRLSDDVDSSVQASHEQTAIWRRFDFGASAQPVHPYQQYMVAILSTLHRRAMTEVTGKATK